MSDAQTRLEQGARFPYDAPDKWWHSSGSEPPPSANWAHYAARGILADLTDRRGIKQGFDDIDEDVRSEMAMTLTDIILAAFDGIKRHE